MPLTVNIIDDPIIKTIVLAGSLDTETAPQFQEKLDDELSNSDTSAILDLTNLEYISSAGLRVIIKLRKSMRLLNGDVYAINLQPQIKKVFDIVKALPSSSIFSSTEEVDQYLDAIQKQVLEEE